MEHRSFVYMKDVDSWVKRCEPCSSMEIDLTGNETGSLEASFWRTRHSIGLTSILRYFFEFSFFIFDKIKIRVLSKNNCYLYVIYSM